MYIYCFKFVHLCVSMCGDVVLGQQYLKNVWVFCISRDSGCEHPNMGSGTSLRFSVRAVGTLNQEPLWKPNNNVLILT